MSLLEAYDFNGTFHFIYSTHRTLLVYKYIIRYNLPDERVVMFKVVC